MCNQCMINHAKHENLKTISSAKAAFHITSVCVPLGLASLSPHSPFPRYLSFSLTVSQHLSLTIGVVSCLASSLALCFCSFLLI